MAKANTASRVRKKVRKTVSEGLCPFMHLSTIPSLQSLTVKAMRCLGLPLAALVLKVLVKVHHLQHKLQQKQLVKLPKSMALKI
ncbi:30S ribosomal protein S11 [Neisseria meningitidis]|nr:30S ribosomal protein S11 [Neisseria meningitidis]